MRIKTAVYLVRNRHETFYFRRTVPPHLRRFFAVKEIYRSLATRVRREAIYRAAQLHVHTEALFRKLESMPKKTDDEDDSLRSGLIVEFKPGPNGKLASLILDVKEHEEAFAERLIPQLMRAASTDAEAPAKQSDVVSESLVTLVNRYCAQQPTWTEESRKDIRGDLMQLVELSDGAESADLTRPRLAQIKDRLLRLPANLNKLPSLRGKSFDEIVALGLPPQSPVTVRKKWTRLTTFLDWCVANGYMKENGAKGMKPKAKPSSYEKFSRGDLERLFTGDHYAQATYTEAFQYWLPLIGLFTGARLEEICQLHISDIRDRDGCHYFAITDEIGGDAGDVPAKRLKNESSKRECPVHRTLIDVGLLEYIADLQARGYTRVFPELAPQANGKVGARASEWFTAFRRSVGVGDADGRSKKVFHSFRHSMILQLQRADVPIDVREHLAGHKSKSINRAVYGGPDELRVLAEHLGKLEYGLTFHRYAPSDQHEEARRLAVRKA